MDIENMDVKIKNNKQKPNNEKKLNNEIKLNDTVMS